MFTRETAVECAPGSQAPGPPGFPTAAQFTIRVTTCVFPSAWIHKDWVADSRLTTAFRFMDQVRALTRRRVPLRTKELIEELTLYCGDGDITTSEPRPKALPPARRLDCAAHSVASIP